MRKAQRVWALGLAALVGIGCAYSLRTVLRYHLYEAARTGDLTRTTSLLRWRWLSDMNLERALYGAAGAGHADVVAVLLDAGADVSEVSFGAVEAGHTEVVALMIEGGADPSNDWGKLALAAHEGHTDIVALLIEAGAEINDCRSNYNGLTRGEAAVGNALNRFVGSPQRLGARAHSGPRYDHACYPRALASAIRAGHTEIAGMLIAAGANVLAKNYGQTPVDLAHEEGRADMIELLDAALELPLAGNVINAAEARDWDRLSRVVARGASVNEPETWSSGRTFGRTALMYAADEGRVDIVSMLLDAGADVTLVTPDSVTALSLATENGHEAVAELLVAAGAQR
jgi:ankyrin repeat protein